VAKWEVKSDGVRGKWVMDRITAAENRSDEAWIRRKYLKMSKDPHAFLRGTVNLYFEDITPLIKQSSVYDEAAVTWITGDAHLENFGTYQDSSGAIVFGPNDFDQGFVANYLYDFWRLAISIAVAGRHNGVSDSDLSRLFENMALSYVKKVQNLAMEGGNFQMNEDYAEGLVKELLEDVKEDKSRKKFLDIWAPMDPTERNFDIANRGEQLLRLEVSKRNELRSLLAEYPGNIEFMDAAQRIDQGLGAIGQERYYILIRLNGEAEMRILDMKLQGEKDIFPFLSEKEKNLVMQHPKIQGNNAATANTCLHAQRSFPDVTAGYVTMGGKTFTIRERSPWKDGLKLKDFDDADNIADLAQTYFESLAMAHAHGDARFDPSFVPYKFEIKPNMYVMASELGPLALAYATQVEKDYDIFMSQIVGPAGIRNSVQWESDSS